jgi:ribonuclease E
MSTRMLIDARHREETRVAVVKGNRIEEFDFEAAAKKQLKGNIYLAKVTRVEPSLQAAFIDYGGNRHGFLAFSEIHPDYYQIPKEDRDALLREEEALDKEMIERVQAEEAEGGVSESDGSAGEDVDSPDEGDEGDEANGSAGTAGMAEDASAGDEHATEAMRKRRMALRRRYKIQEVIRRRQVLLVQVVKEERGNKGAALTTYLSLAGRYSVLMPNTSHGGGISRKISSPADRRRLKSIMAELNLPSGMACIVRTAGLQRTRAEIKRDFEYLTRLWDEIRTATLASTAPALIYEDNDLIKRAIRDIYTREISEVLVDGERGYKAAKTFMKLLMPSHAKKVQPYAHPVPLFQRFQVEGQLAAMFEPSVQLKSGGYIVINPTEALVAIDINSGRSTREHNVEETALKTNLEAADEIARQLRLRDMAGLIVIDFIDMESPANVRKVERQMKEALKHDRARIQIGRISGFGLMEMSRQRLCTGVLEASTHICPMCDGAGIVRSIPSASLSALRALEEEALKARASHFTLRVPTDVSVYILNQKRGELIDLEARYAISVDVVPDSGLIVPNFAVSGTGEPPAHIPAFEQPLPSFAEPDPEDEPDLEAEDEEEFDEEEEEEAVEETSESRRADRREEEFAGQPSNGEREGSRKRRRRRRRRGDRSAPTEESAESSGESPDFEEAASEGADGAELQTADESSDADTRDGHRSRRRGRRGGRRNGEKRVRPESEGTASDTAGADDAGWTGEELGVAETGPLEDFGPEPHVEPAEAVSPAALEHEAEEVAEAWTAVPGAVQSSDDPKASGAAEGGPDKGDATAPVEAVDAAPEAVDAPAEAPVEAAPRKRTRRRAEPGTTRPRRSRKSAAAAEGEAPAPAPAADVPGAAAEGEAPPVTGEAESAPSAEPSGDVRSSASDLVEAATDQPTPASPPVPAEAAPAEAATGEAATGAEPAAGSAEDAAGQGGDLALAPAGTPELAAEEKPARRGWWQRTFGA